MDLQPAADLYNVVCRFDSRTALVARVQFWPIPQQCVLGTSATHFVRIMNCRVIGQDAP